MEEVMEGCKEYLEQSKYSDMYNFQYINLG